MGDITAHWCGTVWETAETLLNFNSRDLPCIWHGGTRVERHLGLVIYLRQFPSDLVQYDFNLWVFYCAFTSARIHASSLFPLAGDCLRATRDAEFFYVSFHCQ